MARFLARRDAIPTCNNEDFLNEAAKVPNFLEEVDQCKKNCSAGGAATPSGGFFTSSKGEHGVFSQPEVHQVPLFVPLQQTQRRAPFPRWSSWEPDQLCP